jgi:hypothetical protein
LDFWNYNSPISLEQTNCSNLLITWKLNSRLPQGKEKSISKKLGLAIDNTVRAPFWVCRWTTGSWEESRAFLESWTRQLSNDAKKSPQLDQCFSHLLSTVHLNTVRRNHSWA